MVEKNNCFCLLLEFLMKIIGPQQKKQTQQRRLAIPRNEEQRKIGMKKLERSIRATLASKKLSDDKQPRKQLYVLLLFFVFLFLCTHNSISTKYRTMKNFRSRNESLIYRLPNREGRLLVRTHEHDGRNKDQQQQFHHDNHLTLPKISNRAVQTSLSSSSSSVTTKNTSINRTTGVGEMDDDPLEMIATNALSNKSLTGNNCRHTRRRAMLMNKRTKKIYSKQAKMEVNGDKDNVYSQIERFSRGSLFNDLDIDQLHTIFIDMYEHTCSV